MARLKGTVAQIRAQCATDVRRRDGEIQRLKRHLEGRRGRDGNGGQVGVVVVTPSIGKGVSGNKSTEFGLDLESPAYSLKQETTEFLTQLSQGLSDENDSLIGLVRGTIATLRSLQGLSNDSVCQEDMYHGSQRTENDNGLIGGPPSFETLATTTDELLEHLRGLLTNPSFVPLEEVEIREEEIHRLREGWEKMAARWKEAVALMDGWKKRMVDTGDTINLNDLEMGMDLGSGIPALQEAQDGSVLKPDEEADANESDMLRELGESMETPLSPEPEPEPDAQACEGLLDVQAPGRALSDRDANARPSISPRKVSFNENEEENMEGSGEQEDVFLLDYASNESPQAGLPKPKSRIPLQVNPSLLFCQPSLNIGPANDFHFHRGRPPHLLLAPSSRSLNGQKRKPKKRETVERSAPGEKSHRSNK